MEIAHLRDPTTQGEEGLSRRPWSLPWTGANKRAFWHATHASSRRYQVFEYRCGRYLVHALSPWVPPGTRIWHLGTRDATLCRSLLAAGYRVLLSGAFLVDLSADRVELSKQGGFLGVADQVELGSLDAVLITNVATLDADELACCIAAARHALRDDGTLILVAPNREELDWGMALCPQCGALFHQWQHVESYTLGRLRTVAAVGGFRTQAMLEVELSEAVLRSQPSVFRDIVSASTQRVGTGDTLVLLARRLPGPVAPCQLQPLADPPLARLQAMEPTDVLWDAASIARFWEGINTTRLAELGFGRQSGRHLLRLLRPWLSVEARHLDYGAGTGELAVQMIDCGYPTATYEPSDALREEQQRRLAGRRGFLGTWTPEQSGTFDTVLLCEVIEHLLPEDLPNVLTGINRVLPLGGLLIVTTPNQEDLSASTLRCPSCATRFHRWQHMRSFSATSLSAMLDEFGFTPALVHQVELTDSAFAANPLFDTLVDDKRPLTVGNGATIVYVGHKVAESIGIHSARDSDAPALPEFGKSASCTFGRLDDLLHAASAEVGDETGATSVLFTQPPNPLLVAHLREDRRVSLLLGPPLPDDVGRGQPRGYVSFNIDGGALPDRFALAPQLLVYGSSDRLSLRLSVALGRQGVRALWLAEPCAARRTIVPWILGRMRRSLRYWLGRKTLGAALNRIIRRGSIAAEGLAFNLLPLPWRQQLKPVVDAWRTRREERRLLAAAQRAPALSEIAPLLTEAAFTHGPVALVNNALAWGGVERQVVYVLKGLARLQARPTVLRCLRLHAGADYRFFLPDLEDERIDIRDIRDADWAERVLTALLEPSRARRLNEVIRIYPIEVQQEIRRFLAEFLDERPSVVHVWQDSASISAGYAAVLAGVPRVILSTRNQRPSHFAYHQPHMAAAYRALAQVSRVVLANNSEAGANDYAKWLGLPTSRFVVVRNGIDPGRFQRPPPAEVASFRSAHDIPPAVPLVGSIFRLYDEKRPLLWVETAARVAEAFPDAHFIIFGTGPLLPAVRARADDLRLCERLHLPGTTRDPRVAISAMTCLLLTSAFEGTPNVILEAQLLGVPVVATDVGGTREAMASGETGWLVTSPTATALAERVSAVLSDATWRQAASRAGPPFVTERFGLQRMLAETLALYESPFLGVARTSAPESEPPPR